MLYYEGWYSRMWHCVTNELAEQTTKYTKRAADLPKFFHPVGVFVALIQYSPLSPSFIVNTRGHTSSRMPRTIGLTNYDLHLSIRRFPGSPRELQGPEIIHGPRGDHEQGHVPTASNLGRLSSRGIFFTVSKELANRGWLLVLQRDQTKRAGKGLNGLMLDFSNGRLVADQSDAVMNPSGSLHR